LDGTPLVLPTFGMYVSVAAAPDVEFRTRVPLLTNFVPAPFVVYVMVVALALAANIKIATPVIEAAWTRRPIVMFNSPLVVIRVSRSLIIRMAASQMSVI
jgi:hypothetical protein